MANGYLEKLKMLFKKPSLDALVEDPKYLVWGSLVVNWEASSAGSLLIKPLAFGRTPTPVSEEWPQMTKSRNRNVENRGNETRDDVDQKCGKHWVPAWDWASLCLLLVAPVVSPSRCPTPSCSALCIKQWYTVGNPGTLYSCPVIVSPITSPPEFTVCPHFFSLFWHIAFLWTVYTQVSVCGLHSKLGEGICKGVSTCSTVTRQKTITLMFPSDSVENPFWWFKLWPEWIDSELSEPESGTKRDRTPHSVSSLWTPVEKRIIDDYAPVGTTLSNWTLFVGIGGTRSLGLAFNE